MFKWFKSKVCHKQIDDPVFGALLYMGGYWEGAGNFPALNENIEWFVDADENGPGESQKELFFTISKKYKETENKVFKVLVNEIEQWVKPDPSPELSKVLRLTSISIPSEETPGMVWELVYESSLRGNPYFAVAMKGWEPTGSIEVST